MDSHIAKLFSLEGRTAIVTGASRGIGAAIAQGLHQAGASVYGVGRSDKPSDSSASYEYSSCDIKNVDRFQDLCKQVFQNNGGLNILVNAAGITIPKKDNLSSRAIFQDTLSTNLDAAYQCCHSAFEFMKQSGCGSIINLTSIGSTLGFPGNPGYIAAKSGLQGLTRALAIDYSSYNIRVNNIAPGYIRTAMTEGSFVDKEKNQQRLDRMILDRWGDPKDLVGAAVFLSSDASSYVTGTDLFVDGGWSVKGL